MSLRCWQAGRRLLHLAAEHGHCGVVQLLLDQKALPGDTDTVSKVNTTIQLVPSQLTLSTAVPADLVTADIVCWCRKTELSYWSL